MSVLEGNDITISYILEGYPVPNVTLINTISYSVITMVTSNVTIATLTIFNVSRTDPISYEVLVDNGLETVSTVTMVTVLCKLFNINIY